MATLTQEEAVERFATLMTPFVGAPETDVHALIQAVASFYEEVRVSGAPPDSDGDMLLLERGAGRPLIVDGFTDLRAVPDGRIKFDPHEYEYIGLTRQAFAPEGEEEVEFDGTAVGLCIYLYYGSGGGVGPSSHVWVATPDELRDKPAEFLRVPLVSQLIGGHPSRINAFVDWIG